MEVLEEKSISQQALFAHCMTCGHKIMLLIFYWARENKCMQILLFIPGQGLRLNCVQSTGLDLLRRGAFSPLLASRYDHLVPVMVAADLFSFLILFPLFVTFLYWRGGRGRKKKKGQKNMWMHMVCYSWRGWEGSFSVAPCCGGLYRDSMAPKCQSQGQNAFDTWPGALSFN